MMIHVCRHQESWGSHTVGQRRRQRLLQRHRTPAVHRNPPLAIETKCYCNYIYIYLILTILLLKYFNARKPCKCYRLFWKNKTLCQSYVSLYRAEALNCSVSNTTNHGPGNGHPPPAPASSTGPLRQRCHIDLLKSVRYGPVVPNVPPAGCDARAAGPESVRV